MIVYRKSLVLVPGLIFFDICAGAQEIQVYAQPATTVGDTCSPQYSKVPNIFNKKGGVNDLLDTTLPPIFQELGLPKLGTNFTKKRRAHAFSSGSIGLLNKPILFERIHYWEIVNCTAVDEFTEACGTPGGDSTRGLYSSGGSLIDPDIRPRIGSTLLTSPYATFTLNSFKIWTPNLIDNCSQCGCKIHILGHKENGHTISHTESFSLINKRTSVTNLGGKGFNYPIKAFDIWVTYTSISNDIGQPFVIDDISFDEWIPLPQPPSYTDSGSASAPALARLTGSCSPSPTATKFTVDVTQIPGDTYLDSENIKIQSISNLVYVSGSSGPRGLTRANTYDGRFGIRSLYIMCRFPKDSDGNPCLVTIYGFRDRFEGSGLPERVYFNLRIPDPGLEWERVVYVNIVNPYKEYPGVFNRLSYFYIICNVGGDNYRASVLDTIPPTRQLGEEKTYRAPNSTFSNFPSEEAPVVSDKPLAVPVLTGTFKSGSGWIMTGQSLYTPKPPGHDSSTPSPKAIHTTGPDTSTNLHITPNPLIQVCDLESIDVIIDYESEIRYPTELKWVVVEVSVTDSSGQSYVVNTAGVYHIDLALGQVHYLFAMPMKVITSIEVHVFYGYSEGGRREIPARVGDLKYRSSKEELGGCTVGCGIEGQQSCGYPTIFRVGESVDLVS